ncbi:Uncharacterised protein [Halioglobus japonicus]|nr:Uncharacterised protein [Halioglobus japonicus]
MKNQSTLLALKGLFTHELPLAFGAMIAVLILGYLKSAATSSGEVGTNLYVVHTPCMMPAGRLRIYNDSGNFLLTTADGVIIQPPLHWTVEGTVLRIVFSEKIYILRVGRAGLLELPAGCKSRNRA